jgi:hypothetical protein
MMQAKGQSERFAMIVRERDQARMSARHAACSVAGAWDARQLQGAGGEGMRRDVNTRAGMVVLVLIGLVFCGIGWMGLTRPDVLMEPVGIALTDKRTLNEVTAMYGGMNFALGLFFVLSALVGRLRVGGLLAALAFLTGLVSGRVTSFVRDGVPEGTGGASMLGMLAAEMIGLLLFVGALLKRRAPAAARVMQAPPSPAAPPPPAPTIPGDEAV